MGGISINVKMNTRVFKQFSYFNNFRKDFKSKMIWFFPLAFLLFGIPLFFINSRTLGTIIIIVGFGYPLIYFLLFNLIINKQVYNQKLYIDRDVYICNFSNSGLFVKDYKGNSISFKWNEIYKIFETNEAFYTYVIPQKAYIIPKRNVGFKQGKNLQKIIIENLPNNRYFDKQHRLTRRKEI